jgi:hypothetical protein
LTPGPGPEIRREIRRRMRFMKMVMPTLTSIQNRHPDEHPPLLPPPPKTIMKRFNMNRQGNILMILSHHGSLVVGQPRIITVERE